MTGRPNLDVGRQDLSTDLTQWTDSDRDSLKEDLRYLTPVSLKVSNQDRDLHTPVHLTPRLTPRR